MTRFSNKFKKPCFSPVLGPFSPFLGKKDFPGKSSSVMHNFIWVSSTMPKFRKSWWYNSKKTPGRQKDGWKDGRIEGQTLLYRNVPATSKGPLMQIQKTAYLCVKTICQNCRVRTPTFRLKNHVIRPFNFWECKNFQACFIGIV